MDQREDTPDLIDVEVDAGLRALLDHYPLPAGVQDADMNQEEIAEALSTSVNTVSKWIRSGMPVAQQGGQGKSYILRLSHCYAWRKAREAESDLRDRHNKQQISLLQAEFLGLDVEDPVSMLSAKDRKALADADIAHSRAMQLRRQLVPLSDVVELLESIFKLVREGVEAMPDRLERELGLRPDQVSAAVRIGGDVLLSVSERIEEAELAERDIEDVEPQRQWVI